MSFWGYTPDVWDCWMAFMASLAVLALYYLWRYAMSPRLGPEPEEKSPEELAAEEDRMWGELARKARDRQWKENP